MIKLPQELIDNIINHLECPSDEQSLRNCSLVARSWEYTSRKRLFKSVDIPFSRLQQWQDHILPGSVFLQHTRTLFYAGGSSGPWKPAEGTVQPVHEALRDYFRSQSFCRLETLVVFFSNIPSLPQQIELFSAFKNTLQSITLWGCIVTQSALVSLINHFPNLTFLDLHRLCCLGEVEPTPSFSLPLVKKLHVENWTRDYKSFLPKLSGLGLRFDEVAFPKNTRYTSFAKRFVDAFGAHAKILRIPVPRISDERLVLSHCLELCELEIRMFRSNGMELDIIPSVTSTKIEKIVIAGTAAFSYPVGNPFWTRLDVILIKLNERSKSKFGLDVEFCNTENVRGKVFDNKFHLPRFVEKGRMTVLDDLNELVYCSGEPKERK